MSDNIPDIGHDPDRYVQIEGNGEFSFEIVGESHYQDALEAICGGKTKNSIERYCVAYLLPEPDNPYDRNAVAVYINGLQVGYIDRQSARHMSKAMNGRVTTLDAVIVGGWRRMNGDEGSFGVKLDL